MSRVLGCLYDLKRYKFMMSPTSMFIDFLVGGFNPFEKYQSNWIISPSRGENTKYLKPPPSFPFKSNACEANIITIWNVRNQRSLGCFCWRLSARIKKVRNTANLSLPKRFKSLISSDQKGSKGKTELPSLKELPNRKVVFQSIHF